MTDRRPWIRPRMINGNEAAVEFDPVTGIGEFPGLSGQADFQGTGEALVEGRRSLAIHIESCTSRLAPGSVHESRIAHPDHTWGRLLGDSLHACTTLTLSERAGPGHAAPLHSSIPDPARGQRDFLRQCRPTYRGPAQSPPCAEPIFSVAGRHARDERRPVPGSTMARVEPLPDVVCAARHVSRHGD